MMISDLLTIVGGASKLARHLGLHHSTVLGWKEVPPRHVPAIARITGIPRHELRPDLWEPPEAGPEERE